MYNAKTNTAKKNFFMLFSSFGPLPKMVEVGGGHVQQSLVPLLEQAGAHDANALIYSNHSARPSWQVGKRKGARADLAPLNGLVCRACCPASRWFTETR